MDRLHSAEKGTQADAAAVPVEGQPSSRVVRDASEVQRALIERPSFTIRMRIIALFALLSILMCGSTISAVIFLSRFEAKIEFLEKLTEYAFEVQQARRFEKNFFLYGTNLQDALENVVAASDHLERNAEDVKRVAGERTFQSMERNLTAYQQTLESFLRAGGEGKPASGPEAQQAELQLRKYGARVIADTEELIGRERLALNEMLHSSTHAAIAFLALMFVAMALVAVLVIRALLVPLHRFEQYAERMARGDYSLILPARKYRDEFSQLAVALNNMLQELDLRQQQLIQSGKMAAVGSLTSGIAHELNNPLNNIGLTTEALIENFAEQTDQEKLKMLDQIYTQVERASSTVRNLLDFTRKDKPVFTDVSISQVVADTAKLLGNEMKLSGVDFSSDVDDSLPTVRGNPRNLQQVFLNIMLNAIQAMPRGGRLTIHGCEAGEFLRVDIEDTGPGIPRDALERIFDPFFTTKQPGEGTGLGLTVSYGIMEAHKGKITVESEIGVGTKFSVYLPLAGGRE